MAETAHFADRLLEAIEKKRNPSVVGLDPQLELIPPHFIDAGEAVFRNSVSGAARIFERYFLELLDHIHEIAPAVKPNKAFWEAYGPDGVVAYRRLVDYAKSLGLVVITDSKRNDIGSTAEAYADGLIGEVKLFEGSTPVDDVDATTVNAYLGSDGVKPFLKWCREKGKGIFVLAKTSNKSSGELQDLELKDGRRVYEAMADLINQWGSDLYGDSGYSSVGAVVGATFPEQAASIRKRIPQALILVPGYGAQGGGAEGVVPSFNEDGRGAIVNSSRGVIYAYKEPKYASYGPERFGDAARQAAIDMRDDIVGALKRHGKWGFG